MNRIRLVVAVLAGVVGFTACVTDSNVDPTSLEDCRSLGESDAYACGEARFWVAFQTRRDLRVETWEMLGEVLDEHAEGDPGLSTERANVYFRRGQLGMAIALEEEPSDAFRFISAVIPDFEQAERLEPEHEFAGTWKASMEIALAHVMGDDEEAVRVYDEIEREVLANPLGNVPSISGTAIGLPLNTGVPQRIVSLLDDWECTGADFCTRNTEHAPWALPGMAYHLAEHYARVGDRETTVQYLEEAQSTDGYDAWPYRWVVEEATADPDALIAKFTEKGEDGSAFFVTYANSSYGCVFCHAP